MITRWRISGLQPHHLPPLPPTNGTEFDLKNVPRIKVILPKQPTVFHCGPQVDPPAVHLDQVGVRCSFFGFFFSISSVQCIRRLQNIFFFHFFFHFFFGIGGTCVFVKLTPNPVFFLIVIFFWHRHID